MGKGATKRYLILSSLWFFCTCPAGSADESDIVRQANQNFAEGKYEEAQANYLQLVSQHVVVPELFFNLGNIWLKQGEIGKAILNFRRSLILNPDFSSAQQSLDTALKTVRNTDENSIHRWLALRPDLLFCTVVTSFWTLAIVVFLWMVSPRFRYPGRILLCVLIPVFVLSLGLVIWIGDGFKNPALAVVIDASADIRYGPALSSRTLVTAGAGQEVRLVEERGDWTLCRLEGGLTGWILTRSVERIIPK
jgi:tetratricopeptide (TPR) repeat protein